MYNTIAEVRTIIPYHMIGKLLRTKKTFVLYSTKPSKVKIGYNTIYTLKFTDNLSRYRSKYDKFKLIETFLQDLKTLSI